VLEVRLESRGSAVPSVQGIWPTANWFEREAWDLLGIEFVVTGVRRLLPAEDWVGHPCARTTCGPSATTGS
jgi:NADH:ubiquinone oxidoreductase subunit C